MYFSQFFFFFGMVRKTAQAPTIILCIFLFFLKVTSWFTVFPFSLWRGVRPGEFLHRCRSVYQNAAQFLAFLLLHPAVLKPNFHLRLVELQTGGDLHPPCPRQVFVEVELFLQLGELLGGEVGADHVVLAGDPELRVDSCGEKWMNE